MLAIVLILIRLFLFFGMGGKNASIQLKSGTYSIKIVAVVHHRGRKITSNAYKVINKPFVECFHCGSWVAMVAAATAAFLKWSNQLNECQKTNSRSTLNSLCAPQYVANHKVICDPKWIPKLIFTSMHKPHSLFGSYRIWVSCEIQLNWKRNWNRKCATKQNCSSRYTIQLTTNNKCDRWCHIDIHTHAHTHSYIPFSQPSSAKFKLRKHNVQQWFVFLFQNKNWTQNYYNSFVTVRSNRIVPFNFSRLFCLLSLSPASVHLNSTLLDFNIFKCLDTLISLWKSFKMIWINTENETKHTSKRDKASASKA